MDITPLMAPRLLAGRLALVTGAGQGIGRAVARGLARAGARVMVVDINGETAARSAADIRADGGEAWAHQLDISSAAACAALARITAAVGPIDLLVNNAGVISRDGIDGERAGENMQRTLEVNVLGTFNVTRAWLADLRATRGAVVNVASISAELAIGGISYPASKGAVKMLTKSLAAELAKDGVRVNAVAPGIIETELSASTRSAKDLLAPRIQRTPLGRIGQPEELIGPIVFLASDMASYITGVTLAVDGGFLAT